MKIAITGGKGGTGKSLVAISLAVEFAKNNKTALLDVDVECPNDHLLLSVKRKEFTKIYQPIPKWDFNKCIKCGKCASVCKQNAIVFVKDRYPAFVKDICIGCKACIVACPQNAISEEGKKVGVVEIGDAGNIQFIHGKLNIGEAMSPPLIRAVKEYINPTRTVIIDVPPGTSCPVIEAVKKSNFCILVTEPTPFGLNDLILAVEVLRKLSISFGVVINRSGIGFKDVDVYCQKENIPILMHIPFERGIALAYSKGIPFTEELPEYKGKFRELFEKIKNLI